LDIVSITITKNMHLMFFITKSLKLWKKWERESLKMVWSCSKERDYCTRKKKSWSKL